VLRDEKYLTLTDMNIALPRRRWAARQGVRMLALSAAGVAGAASLASYEEVRRGAYPLAPHLHLYVRSAPGESLDPVVSEYIRLALSREGQRIIEGLKAGRQGFVPLTPDEAARELSKVNAP
jgi:phosphate transport system substrate-binding protein